ncbi:MAG: hypothetical protein DWQ47_16740 [Acidobacteria bacterium]|nr:MAG: hypothetical protein DWQ32_04140 [Acidobacteriota bacterium]REK02308.1 MAG: hypothetical protein DWQ38_08010 [Acidobacteriota bacterium]REK13889.1 MAG: hypothetical protein DWQ43_09830 [Acidobacteriota bacterium]REK41883.1 MAG: hypothetical protein DWQ47_16740 [Acidobacteriota bacterium]
MKKKKFQSAPRSRAARKKEPLPWKYCLATIFFGALVATGFFFAAQQHFYTMQYGMENNSLRGQIDELRSKNRRLQLQKEVALSPYQIKREAEKLGLTATTVRNLAPFGERPEPLLASTAPAEDAASVATSPVRTFLDKPSEQKPRGPAGETKKPKVMKIVKSAPAAKAEKKKPVEKPVTKKAETSATTRSRVIDDSVER